MKVRVRRWLPWTLCGAAIVMHAAAHVLVVLGIGVETPGDADVNLASVGFLIAFYAFPLVGAVIASRRPDNAIGWLFLALGLVFAATDVASSYADHALFAHPGTVPGGVWAAWAVSWLDPLFFAGVVLLLLLFPTGGLASPRWRIVVWMLGLGAASSLVVTAVRPGVIFEDSLPVENPAAIGGIAGLLDTVDVVSTVLFVGSAALGVVGVVRRFRRSRGVERLQFRWFAASACGLLVSFLSFLLVPLGLPDELSVGLVGLSIAGIAVAVGVAVLRYRLFEIDRVISRTLVYGSLTVVLGALYAGLVLVGQAVFSSFAGGGDLVIAVSTLVVAALFLPVRSRVQALVDRRFYRRRYDAQRTLERFGGRLREQIDLDALSLDLSDVVTETMQPAHASLWLRRPTP
jgi:hypothetical protein